MIAQLVVAAILAAFSPAEAADPGDGPPLRMENALVLAVGPRPPGSGIVAFYADFDVAPPDGGAPQRMYKLWMGTPDEFLPEIGARCTITYRHEPLAGGNGHRHDGQEGGRDDGPHNVVQGLDCGLSPGTQPLSVRAEDFLLPGAPVVLEQALVVAAAPRANVVTSLFEVTTDFEVLAGGTRYLLTMHDDPNEYFPPVGSFCRITYYRPAIAYAVNYRGPNRVTQAVCDSGRFPDLHPDFIERARVVSVSTLPIRNGRRPRYVQFEVERIGRGAPTLYLSLAEGAPSAPVVGAECSIAFTYATLQGPDIGLPPRDTHWLPVVDRLDCG